MTLLPWQDRFGTESACHDYLFQQRWPEGFVCPKCQNTACWRILRSDRTALLYECQPCHHQASMTANAVFHRTNVDLRD